MQNFVESTGPSFVVKIYDFKTVLLSTLNVSDIFGYMMQEIDILTIFEMNIVFF